MKRRLTLLVVALMLLASFVRPGYTEDAPKGDILRFDPSVPVHPYLQYGVQVQPERWIRVIVQMRSSDYDVKAFASSVKAKLVADYPFIRSFVLEIKLQAVPELAKEAGVRYISVDGPGKKHSVNWEQVRSTYLSTINLPDLLGSQVPATGKGVTVAVIDTGVDTHHPALKRGSKDEPVDCVKENGKAAKCDDDEGHGTHVVGIIRTRDPQGLYLGVAPDAKVIAVRIDDDKGVIRESDLLNGLQWVYQNRVRHNIRVVNLSVSAGLPNSYRTSPIAAAVEKLWTSGVVVVASAGNRGSAYDAAWYPPGNDPLVISVGALDHNSTASFVDDRLALFSSRGLTQDGFYKPEILAPGRGIVAPLGKGVRLSKILKDRIIDKEYIRLSGTSMSAPMVSGVAALLLERFPSLTPDQVKWILVNSARSYPNQVDKAGVVDPLAAIRLAAAGNVQEANQEVLDPARAAFASSGRTDWDAYYWDAYYWDAYYWDAYYWDAYYWDAYYWDAYYWDAYYWDSDTSDNADLD